MLKKIVIISSPCEIVVKCDNLQVCNLPLLIFGKWSDCVSGIKNLPMDVCHLWEFILRKLFKRIKKYVCTKIFIPLLFMVAKKWKAREHLGLWMVKEWFNYGTTNWWNMMPIKMIIMKIRILGNFEALLY